MHGGPRAPTNSPRVGILYRTCGGCSRKESNSREFLTCSGCKSVEYCTAVGEGAVRFLVFQEQASRRIWPTAASMLPAKNRADFGLTEACIKLADRERSEMARLSESGSTSVCILYRTCGGCSRKERNSSEFLTYACKTIQCLQTLFCGSLCGHQRDKYNDGGGKREKLVYFRKNCRSGGQTHRE